jgi:hypothetical protein
MAEFMLFSLVYVICAAAVLCGAFALMGQAFQAGPAPARNRRPRHPEAPEPGQAVLYVDLNRERLEQLYQQTS